MISAVRLFFVLVVCALSCAHLSAQDDVIARARTLAAAGNRVEALTLLQSHLEKTPNDVDARLIYGLVLSWDGKYDEAREQLTRVLTTAPDYLDARVALMNVEWWSGNLDRASDHMRMVLATDPGNEQARRLRQRLDAKTRAWFAGSDFTNDSFSDGRDSWQEFSVNIGRETPVGSLRLNLYDAHRFDLRDQQWEIEFYPIFRAGSYAYVAIGVGAEQDLYPEYRVAFDVYQSLGKGIEVSGGYRHLAFSDATDIYLATLTKYLGNWMLTGKTSFVPDQLTGDSWTYEGLARWYFGDRGTSFIGGGYSHGFNREEPRGEGDLVHVDGDTFRSQAEVDISDRVRIKFSAGTTRQGRTVLSPLWQTTLSTGLKVRF